MGELVRLQQVQSPVGAKIGCLGQQTDTVRAGKREQDGVHAWKSRTSVDILHRVDHASDASQSERDPVAGD
jgi:hypothetical protein